MMPRSEKSPHNQSLFSVISSLCLRQEQAFAVVVVIIIIP